MKRAVLSAAVITVFTLSSQLVLFFSQIVAAAQFGAGLEMDAFLAASTLPQYIISVLLGSLGFVFIPFFIDYKIKGDEKMAYRLMVDLFNICIVVLGFISILGIIFAKPLILLTTPGLSEQGLALGVKVAYITWPTILATGALSLLTSIYQAEKKFKWQAFVPFVGALTTLGLLILLSPKLGIIGLAWATTCGVIVQVILLIRILASRGDYQFSFRNDPAVFQILKVVTPLILVAIVTKFTPLIDRFLASDLTEGSISHLNYAFKIIGVISILISTGGATVIFPKMASQVTSDNLEGLGNTMFAGLRMMWFIVAPSIAVGIPLALPVVLVLLNRGAFTIEDSIAVADLLKVYLFGLVGMALGSVTSKVFYVLKDTRTLAAFGSLEAAAYAGYTIYLTHLVGVIGIAVGYVIYFSGSIAWHLIFLGKKIGGFGQGRKTISSAMKISVAAIVGGIVANAIVTQFDHALVKIVIGGFLGLSSYLITLLLIGSQDLKDIIRIFWPGFASQSK